MSFTDYSGSKGSRVGAGQVSSTENLDALYRFSSPEALSSGIRLPNAYWGQATVAGGADGVTVTFDEPRADASYLVFLSFSDDPDAAVAAHAEQKTASQFRIELDAPVAGAINVNWLVIG